MRVNLIETKFRLAKRFKNVQDVQSPPACFCLDVLKRFKALKLLSNSLRRDWNSIQNDWYSCALGNGAEQNVAANPIMALRRRR